jgi:hypothetical protein
MSCLTIDAWLDQGDPTGHAAACPSCATLVADLEGIQAGARALDPGQWPGEPPLALDVEGALEAVLATAEPPRSARPRALALRMASSLAAAVLLSTLVLPSLLRWRIDGAGGTAVASPRGAQPTALFWTTQ